MGNALVTMALLGWIPVVLAVFCILPPRRAVIAAFLGAWLFLPMAGIKIAEGIPVYDKMNATCVGVLLAAMLFDFKRLATFRPALLDLPMLLWCVCPLATSLSNELGVYDGLSGVFEQTVTWGLPYFIGRVYFPDLESIRELALGIFIGGLVYVPLCLLEVRMSPQLHLWVYGYHQHSFVQTMRFGGFRPMVFMQHGLMVGMWMCMAGLVGMWLWYTGAVRRVGRVPAVYAALAVVATAILCKSAGAILLLAAGGAALGAAMWSRSRVLVGALILVAPAYMVLRGSGMWDGAMLVSSAQTTAGAARSDSLAYRIHNENILAAKAMERPVLGWGGWARNRVLDKYGRDISTTDGLWIIALGMYGIMGLSAWTLAMLAPAGWVLARYGVARWREPLVGGAVVLALVVVLYVIDCVPNGMVNPMFTMCVGALGSLAAITDRIAGDVHSAVPLRLVTWARANPRFGIR